MIVLDPKCHILSFIAISPLVLERIFEGFLPHMGVGRPSWSCDPDPKPMEASHEIWLQSAQWFQRKRCLKILTDDGQTTDALLYCKLMYEPKDSGELINNKNTVNSHCSLRWKIASCQLKSGRTRISLPI